MKIVSEKLCYFRDISKTRVPISMLKNAQLDDFKITLEVYFFSSDILQQQYVLFYADEENARDDYAKILRLFKKLKGK